MITVPAGVRIHLALGATDMRRGFDGLSLMVQEVLRADPFSGHLFVFRGKRSSMVKILFHDGNGILGLTRPLATVPRICSASVWTRGRSPGRARSRRPTVRSRSR